MPFEQYGYLPARPPGCHLNIETHLTSIGIPIIKIRRSHDRLIFIMVIPMPGKFLYWNRPLAALLLCLLLCMAEWWPDYLLHWVHCIPPIVTHLGTNTAPGNIGKPVETQILQYFFYTIVFLSNPVMKIWYRAREYSCPAECKIL